MKTVILIGFQYNSDYYLPGIIVDLYVAYYAALNMKPDRLLMITDIASDVAITSVNDALRDSIVRSNVLSFIKEVKDNNFYWLYNEKQQFKEKIDDMVTGCDRVCIYYSGHSENGNMVLPFKEQLSMMSFKDIVISRCKSDAQIAFIMDCCQEIHFNLPYILKDGKYRVYSDKGDFLKQTILVIDSCSNEGYSHTMRSGSIFTRSFFKNFGTTRLLQELALKIEEDCKEIAKQKVKYYSSDLHIHYIWPWLVGLPDINILYDDYTSSIIIQKDM